MTASINSYREVNTKRLAIYEKSDMLRKWKLVEYVSANGRKAITVWRSKLPVGLAPAFMDRFKKDKWISPDIDGLAGKKYQGLSELRWKCGKPHRIIGYTLSDHIFLMLIGCTHDDDKYDPRDCLDTAVARKKTSRVAMQPGMNINSRLIREMLAKEYREGYVAAQIAIGLPNQIRALRTARKLTQGDLAKLARMSQPRISEIEKPGERSLNLDTLMRIASAFDVGLEVRLVPFSKLIRNSEAFDPDSFAVASFDEELKDHKAQGEERLEHLSHMPITSPRQGHNPGALSQAMNLITANVDVSRQAANPQAAIFAQSTEVAGGLLKYTDAGNPALHEMEWRGARTSTNTVPVGFQGLAKLDDDGAIYRNARPRCNKPKTAKAKKHEARGYNASRDRTAKR